MKRVSLLLAVFINIIGVIAQKQNPPDILWKSLKSEHFEVIFPNEIEGEAQRVANTLEWVYQYDTKSLDVKPKPVSLVLYNRSNTSNAFAGLGPRRMGWYLTPSQSVTGLGNIDWAQTLAIHEYRHIVQYAKNRQHFTKFMTYLFGDIGQYMMRWSIPDWFFEGDAIVMETALTKGGRGRIPAFAMNIRAYQLNNEKFTYDQAYLGSYKRYYPSHYHLGYPLTAYGRVNYGNDIWDKVLTKTNKNSWWPYAFGNSLKKYTGTGVNKFYKAAMNEYDSIWKKQDELIKPTEFKQINKKKRKSFTNYLNPKYSKSGSIICKKGSLDKIPAFYEIKPDGKEIKIKNTDAGIFNLSNDILCWTRTIPDARWGERSYADVVMLGLKGKIEKKLTKKGRYLSPALSPNGKTIAVVEHDSLQKTKLLLIDVESGNVKNIISNSIGSSDYLRTPAWSEDGELIAFTHSKYNGTALSIYNVITDEVKNIIDYGWNNIGRPVFHKNYILYNSDYSGIGNINAVDINSGERFQVTSSRFGAYNADVSVDRMVYQEYTKDGFDIAEIDLDPANWKRIENVTKTEPAYYQPLVEQEGGQSIDEATIPDKKYPVEKYKKFRDGIKFHSWGVYPAPPYIGVRLVSNNYLNTLSLTGGYLYNTNEKTNAGYLAFSYSKFYPVLSVVSTFGEKKNTYEIDTITNLNLKWNEFSLKAGLSVPFNLSRNVYNTNISVGGGVEYKYIDEKEIRYADETFSGNFTPLYASFSFMNYRNYAWRDFAPKFGQFFYLDYKRIMPYDNSYKGYLFSGRSSFYFPGLLPHNSIKLSAAYEKQLTYNSNTKGLYYFSSETSFPRGYTSSAILDDFYKLSADYQLPLWSPDLSIGSLAYIRRIRLGGFYDYLNGSIGGDSRTYESVGGSIRFEFNVFRIRYPLELGVQYAYKLKDNDYQISILILGLPI